MARNKLIPLHDPAYTFLASQKKSSPEERAIAPFLELHGHESEPSRTSLLTRFDNFKLPAKETMFCREGNIFLNTVKRILWIGKEKRVLVGEFTQESGVIVKDDAPTEYHAMEFNYSRNGLNVRRALVHYGPLDNYEDQTGDFP